MEYSVERIQSSTKAFGSGFMMLSCNMYSIFTHYLMEGRVRAPPASELRELEPTFQEGARTDRRALQSKFKSWAKRMILVDGKLVMCTTGKLIIPSEYCEMVIKGLHFRDPESHLTIDEIVSEIQKTYTWNKKNFGMDWNIVANTLKHLCQNEKCLENLHARLFRSTTTSPPRENNKLTVQNMLSAKRFYLSGEWQSLQTKNSLVPFPASDMSQILPFRRQKFLKALKPKQIVKGTHSPRNKKAIQSTLQQTDKRQRANSDFLTTYGDTSHGANETVTSDAVKCETRPTTSTTPFVLKLPTVKKHPVESMEETGMLSARRFYLKQGIQKDAPSPISKRDFMLSLGLVEKNTAADGVSGDCENEAVTNNGTTSKARKTTSNTPFVLKLPARKNQFHKNIKKEPVETVGKTGENQDDIQARKKPAWRNILSNNCKYVIPVKVETTRMFQKVPETKSTEATTISEAYETVNTVKMEVDENDIWRNFSEQSLETGHKGNTAYSKTFNLSCSSIPTALNYEVENKLKDLYQQVLRNKEKEKRKAIQKFLIPREYQTPPNPMFRGDAVKIEGPDGRNSYVPHNKRMCDGPTFNPQERETNSQFGSLFWLPPRSQLAVSNTWPFRVSSEVAMDIKQEPISGKFHSKATPLKKRILAAYEAELANTEEETLPIQPEETYVEKKPRIWRPDPEIMEKQMTNNTAFELSSMSSYMPAVFSSNLLQNRHVVVGVAFPPTVPYTTLTTTNTAVTPRVLTSKPLLPLPSVTVEEPKKCMKLQKKREKEQNIFGDEDNIYDRMEEIRRLVETMYPDFKLSLSGLTTGKTTTNTLEMKFDVALTLVDETRDYLDEDEE